MEGAVFSAFPLMVQTLYFHMKNPLHALLSNQIEKVAANPIKYLAGHPRPYRFDASRGVINLNGETVITKKGEAFTFIPIAYRIFQDNILGLGKKKWAEFFFLNQASQVCNLLVHGYSVDQLMRTVEAMFYDEANLCEVELTLKPIERTNQASGNKYFVSEFSYRLLEQKPKDILFTITSELELWREETFTGDAEVMLVKNYHPPVAELREIEPASEASEKVPAALNGVTA